MTIQARKQIDREGLYVRPIPIKRALRWNVDTHRRLPALQGGMWAIAVLRSGLTDAAGVTLAHPIVGVAIVGRPTARHLDSSDETLNALQVLRVAVREGDRSDSGHKGACSKLYATCARMARESGATDCLTYIHDDESGVSLKAAGWIEDVSFRSVGGEWDRPSRRRLATVEAGAKRRFAAPWSLMVAS